MIFRNCFFYLVTFIGWISSLENRKMAFKYYKMGKHIYNLRKKDSKQELGLKFIAQTFFDVTKNLSNEGKKEVATQIHKDVEKLSDISMDYDVKKQEANVSVFGLNLGYSPKTGSTKFSYKINF